MYIDANSRIHTYIYTYIHTYVVHIRVQFRSTYLCNSNDFIKHSSLMQINVMAQLLTMREVSHMIKTH